MFMFISPNADNKHLDVSWNMVVNELDSLEPKKVQDHEYIRKGIR